MAWAFGSGVLCYGLSSPRIGLHFTAKHIYQGSGQGNVEAVGLGFGETLNPKP